jgi:hypothetical protein
MDLKVKRNNPNLHSMIKATVPSLHTMQFATVYNHIPSVFQRHVWYRHNHNVGAGKSISLLAYFVGNFQFCLQHHPMSHFTHKLFNDILNSSNIKAIFNINWTERIIINWDRQPCQVVEQYKRNFHSIQSLWKLWIIQQRIYLLTDSQIENEVGGMRNYTAIA